MNLHIEIRSHLHLAGVKLPEFRSFLYDEWLQACYLTSLWLSFLKQYKDYSNRTYHKVIVKFSWVEHVKFLEQQVACFKLLRVPGKIKNYSEIFFFFSCLIVRNTEKAMASHSSTLAWKIPWTEEPGGLQSRGLPRVGHDWATSLSIFTFHFHTLEKDMATHSSVLAWRIPGTGEPGGLPSMGSHRVEHD